MRIGILVILQEYRKQCRIILMSTSHYIEKPRIHLPKGTKFNGSKSNKVTIATSLPFHYELRI